MKPTTLSIHITNFLTHYLAAQRNVSPNTIKAYRDVFTLFLRFCRDVQGIPLEKLQLAQVDVCLVEAFLDYLEKERGCAICTRNHRLSALHAFLRYVQSEEPNHLFQCQRVLAIPLRKSTRATVGYLPKEKLAEILARPDMRSREGRRDAVLLSVLYDTAARVQELIDLSVGDIRLSSPEQARLMGKGRKMRVVPLMEGTSQLLRDYIQENELGSDEQFDRPLFRNRRGDRLSRSGVRYILQKYVNDKQHTRARQEQKVSPHTFRHTKAMHLIQSDVSLDVVRDFLGHADARTTQIYARASLEMKRKALEKTNADSPVPTLPSWQQNKGLLEWLHSL